MIKTPVIYDETATVFYPYPQISNADGEFLFECKEAGRGVDCGWWWS